MALVNQTLIPSPLYRIALICAGIQFTHALEYMMFNPIFAFMAASFSVPVSWSGYVTGIYTLASMVSGFLAWRWIDKFNKRLFLTLSMLFLALLTMIITLTDSFIILMGLRFLAGMIGGVSMGVASAILINQTPEPLRPRILALVIASFSLVSIFGMPVILFICERWGWHFALWLIGVLCLICIPFIVYGLSPDAESPAASNKRRFSGSLLRYASAGALTQFSPMLILPVLVPLLLTKMQVDPGTLPALFFVGGVTGLVATRLSGKLISWCSGVQLSVAGTLSFIVSLIVLGVGGENGFWFIGLFMGAAYCRLVAASAVVVNYPDSASRASFNMLQTALMSLSTALAFFISSWLLGGDTISDSALNRLLWLAGSSALILPYCLQRLARRLEWGQRVKASDTVS